MKNILVVVALLGLVMLGGCTITPREKREGLKIGAYYKAPVISSSRGCTIDPNALSSADEEQHFDQLVLLVGLDIRHDLAVVKVLNDTGDVARDERVFACNHGEVAHVPVWLLRPDKELNSISQKQSSK